MPMPGLQPQGYPPASQPGYPQSNQGFPIPNSAPQTFGNPMSMPGVSMPGYPPNSQPGYPSSSQPGYPLGSQPGYPPSSQPGYPPNTQQGYPQANPGFPSNQSAQTFGHPAGVHPQAPQPAYPQTNPGYPSAYNQTPHLYGNSMAAHHSTAGFPGQAKSRPSVHPANPFNPQNDAAVLRKAMKGFGTDEKAIIQVLTKRSNEQRQKIAIEFKTLYGKDLISDLKSESSGRFRDLLVALMMPLAQFYAKEMHDAMAGVGTDDDVLIEVMCTLSNAEIRSVKEAYKMMYKKDLEKDIRGDTSGSFKRLMTSLCMANRPEDFNINPAKAKEDARKLYEAGENKVGTDESAFNAVLCGNSYTQLRATFEEYKALTKHDFMKAVTSEFSGDIKKALVAIVKVVENRTLYFAEVLQKSMKGLGTDDRKLIRTMVTRSEVDLGDIAAIFPSKYNNSLQKWIEDDCSGHYKNCLIGLLNLI